ncbi:MAG: hypothetical protein ACK5PG_01105 [Lysobacterales bacterium]
MRQAWLCGRDPETGKDYKHLKDKVEARILKVGSVFAVSNYSYAVMSNHLPAEVSLEPSSAMNWTDADVVDRSLQVFPTKEPEQMALKRERLLGNTEPWQPVDPGWRICPGSCAAGMSTSPAWSMPNTAGVRSMSP